jgi:hypothetical protein
MKLLDWMQREQLDDQQVADRLNALPSSSNSSAAAVKKWKYGERIPRSNEMQGLFAISGGEVTANDFYGIEAERAAS